MSIRVALHHATSYDYDDLVVMSPQVVRLRPAPHCRTPISAYRVQVEPEKHFLNWQQDPQGNWQARVVFPDPIKHMRIAVDLVADLAVINPFDFFIEDYAEQSPFTYREQLARELTPYLHASAPGPLLSALIKDLDRSPQRTVDFLVALNQRLYNAISYVIRMEPGIQTCEETLEKASGSCRDSAWLLVNLCRHVGLAARFTSGYLIQLTPDQKSVVGPSGPSADFTDLHAWCEVYLPGAGWVGLDPTSGLMAGEGHIPLASSADPINAAPITGGFRAYSADSEIESTMAVEMAVARLPEKPRQTRPYTDEQWKAIFAAGQKIDQQLRADNVRLTVGGEPTFVASDNPDSPEWNTAALGPEKRARAEQLLWRLREHIPPGSFLHKGQGKWYPGEELPRWALSCYWRTDGTPLWHNDKLLARHGDHHGATPQHAEQLLRRLGERLGVGDKYALPAFEDAFYYLWRERRLPADIDIYKCDLDDEAERARLARIFSQGLNHVVGWTLPLRSHPSGHGWQSGPWFLRDERLRLIPGDSAMGFRLPLDSLPWENGQREALGEVDPTALPLPPWATPVTPAPKKNTYAPFQNTVRTALCFEPRDGIMHVFLPPITDVAAFFSLIHELEQCASELNMPLVFEGYKPPYDPRIRSFAITPDPGVIEVNVQPTSSWDEFVTLTNTVYEEARQCHLSAEKFMLDGRHTGTGGGNHITLGGATPHESPFLRRPDVLGSLIAYFHNHPSLSYLFSGLFIGPTSQAPRADEARSETVYELQLALKQLPANTPCPPWLVDRILRNVLIDATGNTHRAEFSIDKLWAPDGATGRLGLLEMRGFEMPPHPQMAAAQNLLIRALLSWFWRTPYTTKLARWGTELHDRWMLPAVIAEDIADVVNDLRAAGYLIERSWFAPHQEFRFPTFGSITHRGLELTITQALEPWHVMGEDPGPGGTVRYVDSSLERVQVTINGATDSRHVVLCNGQPLPLRPTSERTKFIAGVRYRAWQPPACLHPTIPAHAPLIFDVVDTWNNRAVAGCTYHVAHPAGRNYERFPINANEAEARRIARFQPFGHTPGTIVVPPLQVNGDYPYTLDLRWR
jgi:uncharacterized protein (DUF2126 family)/transglutaminase-like putative cysteine protease